MRKVFLLTSICFSSIAFSTEPIDIGSRRELFVDHLLIENLKETTLKLHTPIKAPRPNSPLPVRHMVSVIKDGDLYRAYYRSSDSAYTGEIHTGHAGETVHYAESDDGHEWRFPILKLHEVDGTLKNNAILARQPPFLTNFMPFLDTRPNTPKSERFKAVAGYPGPGDKRGTSEPGRGLFAFYSADGIHWEKQQEIIPYQSEWRHAFDSPNVAFWSAAEQQYVCYFRTWSSPERLRTISRSTSPDFKTWTKPVALAPNLPGEHLYTNGTHPYIRAPHLYIAFPTRYVPGRGDAPDYDLRDRNATDILFMTTRAGSERYDRTFTNALIRPGLDPNQWRNRSNYVAQNVVQTAPHELSIYHRSGDRYTIRPDGFVSIHAGSEVGELITKPLQFEGNRLSVNYSTSAAGSLRIEIQNEAGEAIPGFELKKSFDHYGDTLDETIRWNGNPDLRTLSGKAVRLRFVIRECDLYSFKFETD